MFFFWARAKIAPSDVTSSITQFNGELLNVIHENLAKSLYSVCLYINNSTYAVLRCMVVVIQIEIPPADL